ncbi:MAG: hypothetical protein HOO09_13370 [Rhodospirillaceae bacterium]|nr:hypothetical protein [Rhodospirillaceae bacterium]
MRSHDNGIKQQIGQAGGVKCIAAPIIVGVRGWACRYGWQRFALAIDPAITQLYLSLIKPTVGFLPESDVTDAYGTVVTLIVDDLSLDVCAGTSGRLGNLTLFGGSQPNALYALISHGENKRGGYMASGTQVSVAATAVEADNCADGSACTDPDTVSVTIGPHNDDGNSDLHFDDRVQAADSTDFDSLCLSIHGP